MIERKMRDVRCRKFSRRTVLSATAAVFAVKALFAQNAGSAGAGTLPAIRDIAPPVDALPYPAWQIAIGAGIALLLVSLVIWAVVKFLRNRPAALPPTARESALAALRDAAGQLDALDPYAFSILVSDILRRYVSAQFGLRAMEQTSPEFLARVADSARFSEDEKTLLGAFLEKCDMIKFAHVAASREDSATLLAQAREFVERAAVHQPGKAHAMPPPLPQRVTGSAT